MVARIVLPGVTVEYEKENGALPLLMVLGGRAPAPGWLAEFGFRKEVWAVDKGIDLCRRAGIVPRRLIGDKDSADPNAWRWAVENGVFVAEYESEKDLTDFQIALSLVKEEGGRGRRPVFVTACFGGRFDHLWSAVVSFLHASDGYLPVGMADDSEGMFFINGPGVCEFVFDEAPEAVSLIPFSCECRGVCLSGVRWPLKDAVLEYEMPYSISNRLDHRLRAGLSAESGLVGFYWKWRDLR